MLMQSLRALCEAPGGPASIRKYLDVLERVTSGSRRYAYDFELIYILLMHLGGGHILATVANDIKIFVMQRWLVAKLLSYCTEIGGNMVESLHMSAVQ
jgi:hypothetical protein